MDAIDDLGESIDLNDQITGASGTVPNPEISPHSIAPLEQTKRRQYRRQCPGMDSGFVASLPARPAAQPPSLPGASMRPHPRTALRAQASARLRISSFPRCFAPLRLSLTPNPAGHKKTAPKRGFFMPRKGLALRVPASCRNSRAGFGPVARIPARFSSDRSPLGRSSLGGPCIRVLSWARQKKEATLRWPQNLHCPGKDSNLHASRH